MLEKCDRTRGKTSSYLAWDRCFGCMQRAAERALRDPELSRIAILAPLFLPNARLVHIPPSPLACRNPDRSSSIAAASGLQPQAPRPRDLVAAITVMTRLGKRLRTAYK